MEKHSRRIGIFAGAFDPVHDGHVEVAKSAIKHLGLDKVYFMVEKKPWSDKHPVDLEHRNEMVKLALSNDEKLYLHTSGTERFDLLKTLDELENKFKDSELFFILGADVFMNMDEEQWPGLERLFKHYVVVFERRDIDEAQISDHAKDLGIVVAVLPSELPHHASGDVRMKPHDKEIWVPKKVARYIDENNLYG